MRKGFYFSFDALVALTLLGITTVLLLGATSPLNSGSDTTVESFRQANLLAEDSAQMATRSSLERAFSRETVDRYVEDTALDEDDREKSVLDAVAILWASNESRAARDVSKDFFEDIVPQEYGYRVSIISGNRTTVYNTSSVPENVETLATARRIVSGVQKNRPQQGYLSRARATQVEKNTTEVFGIPMAGSAVKAGDDRSLDINRSFHLDAEKITNATFYVALKNGGADPPSIDILINGEDAGFPNNWDYEVGKNGQLLLFHSEDVASLLRDGWNWASISAKNTGSNNEVEDNVHINPGTRIEATYTSNETGNLSNVFSDRKYFSNIETIGHHTQNDGIWSVMSYYVPEGAEVTNVTLNVHALDVDEVGEDEVDEGEEHEEFKLYLNDEKVNGTDLCTSNCNGERDFQFRFNLTNRTEPGTNVVAVYLDTFLDDEEEIVDFGDEDHIQLYSKPQVSGSNSSYLQYDYERARTGLVFGKIELARTERIGGARSNPKSFNVSFNENSDLLSTFLHLAQLDSQNVTVTAEDGEESTAFMSPRDFATPTDIFIHPQKFETDPDVNNTVNVSDECTVECDVLPETTFERRLLIASQVPYGDTFQNRSAAQEDAEARLNETLGEFVDATDIDSSTLSVNDVPWLFGPVTFEVEVWRE